MIDTDILVDAARAFAPAATFLDEQIQSGSASVSIVTAMELIAGCRSADQMSRVREALGQFRVIPLSEAASLRARQILEEHCLARGVLLPDALIAAAALESQEPLYTRNERHFSFVEGLTVIRPY